ncbi:MAG: hypothetical protein JW928_00615 [Candidatus Aureabacteria bacterium]|nr:hypothetical protein [Candidatus Auribacterota bacterium]
MDTEKAKAIIQRILRESEFRDYEDFTFGDQKDDEEQNSLADFLKSKKEAFFNYLYEKVGKDIDKIIEKIKNLFKIKERDKPLTFRDFISEYSMHILTVLVILAIAVIVYFLFKYKRKGRTEKDSAISFSVLTSEKINPTDISYDDWQEMAQKYSSAGNYLLALRAIYLSLLSYLHRERVIIYDKNKTNWEYYFLLKRKQDIEKEFHDIIVQYEKNWYGKTPCCAEDFTSCNDQVRNIKQKLAFRQNESN